MFEQEFEKNPKNIAFLIQLIKLYIHQGELEKATKIYE